MDIYTFLLTLTAILAVFFSYRQGVRDGRGEQSSPKATSKRTKRGHTESDEMRKLRIEWENIEHYGTDVPQQEVE